MTEGILNNPGGTGDGASKTKTSWRARSCAALLGASALIAITAQNVTPAAAQTAQKPNILFIMGDDIGIYAAEHLPSRPDGR